jgi:hypothetical protein
MDLKIISIISLNFIIALIGTLAYSIRIVGVRTGKIAVSFALFSTLALVSRVAYNIQLPFLTKYVDQKIEPGRLLNIIFLIIIFSGIATIIGALLIPTFQRIFSKYVQSFSIERSVPKLILHSFSKTGVRCLRESVKIPSKQNITGFNVKHMPKKIIIYNSIAVSLLTVGALAPVYAASIDFSLRATCTTLSGYITSLATILMSVFIDPHLSIMTDDVIDGKCDESKFRGCIIAMVGSKMVGTFASLIILIPASYVVLYIAKNYIL